MIHNSDINRSTDDAKCYRVSLIDVHDICELFIVENRITEKC